MYEFNRRMFAFEDLVKELRPDNDAIVSTHHVMLPFPVDPTTLRTRFVGTEDGAKYCHVDLAEKARKVVDKVYNMQTSKNRGRHKEMNEYSNLTPSMMKWKATRQTQQQAWFVLSLAMMVSTTMGGSVDWSSFFKLESNLNRGVLCTL